MKKCGWGWGPVVAGAGLHGLCAFLPSVTFLGSLKSVMVGVFTPPKLAIATHPFPTPTSRMDCPGLPSWSSGKECTCQCREHRFDPWSRKIPRAMERLSLCSATTEPALWSPGATTTEAAGRQLLTPPALEPEVCNKRRHHSEKPEHRNQRVAPAPRN